MSSYKTVVKEIGAATRTDTAFLKDSFASDGGLGGTRGDQLLSKTGNAVEREALLASGGGTTETRYLDALDTSFASDGGLGGTRDPALARSGNYAVDQYLATLRDPTGLASKDSFASDGGLGGTRDPEVAAAANQNLADVAGSSTDLSDEELDQKLQIIEASHQASVSTIEDLPPDLLASLPPETILRLAYSPEDMATLDLNLEHELIGIESNLLSVNNPDQELADYLLGSKQFQDVILSGHGNEDGIFVTNDEGKAELMTSDEVAALMCDAGVEEILLNVCDGGATLDDALNDVGISTFAHDRDIYDAEAIEDARAFAETGSLASISTEEDIYGGDAVYNDVSERAAAIPAEDAKVDVEAVTGLEEEAQELTRSERRKLRREQKAERIAARKAERSARRDERQAGRAERRAEKKAKRKAGRRG